MTKQTRLIILLVCVVLFFVLTPLIVGYSLGYRFDFKNKKIVATGGIYVRVLPEPAEIFIDSELAGKTNMLSNSVFSQNLLPNQHSVAIKKDGYFDYQKTLDVKEKEVTKLENVILFKKNIVFEAMADKTQSPFAQKTQPEKFLLKNNNLYYSNVPENAGVSASEKSLPVIKGLVAWKILNNNITWLGKDGILYQSDLTGKNTQKISANVLKIIKSNSYKIISAGQNIFLTDNDNLLALNGKTKNLDNFYSPVKDAEISPSGQQIFLRNDYEILLYSLGSDPSQKMLLNRFSEKINNCFWLNNDYVIYNLGNKIEISEIDIRGNINIIDLPIDAKNSEIFFNQQEEKLYVLTDKTVLVSEKLTP